MQNSLLPRRIGNVRVMERLGEGGMAVVHRGEDIFRPDRPLAIKFLKSEAHGDPDLVRRFLQEGDVLQRVRHPHLVEVHGAGRSGPTPYIVMELLPGGSVKLCKGDPPSTLIRRILPVLDALQTAHDAGVIHRDLKPSNLLFTNDGRLKVTDFGVCLLEGDEATRGTRSRMVVGTLGYMAPEQHGDPRKVDGRADVYAMGAILYEYTTGQPWSQVQLPPSMARPGFPPGLAAIIMQALAANPARRTPSMDALRTALATWLEGAAAATWGEEALPGFTLVEQEAATVSRSRPDEALRESSADRLGPYLDALRTGDVGARRAAAEGLSQSVRGEDETFLLDVLTNAPEGARFALVTALGHIGTEASLETLQTLLEDPFARTEAARALAEVAVRTERIDAAMLMLREPGLGSPWRWAARARVGDFTWVNDLVAQWPTISEPQRIQALEAASLLPETERARLKDLLTGLLREGSELKKLWHALRCE